MYDVDVNDRTAPHHLGVLSHYKAVVWEHGDDIITACGRPTGRYRGRAGARPRADGPRLPQRGRQAALHGQVRRLRRGANGGLLLQPVRGGAGECTSPRDPPCLPLLNDFQQYWLGAYNYVDDGGTGDAGPYPLAGVSGAFNGFAGTLNGGDSADNQDHTAAFLHHVELPAGRAVPAVRELGAVQVAAAGRRAVRPDHR